MTSSDSIKPETTAIKEENTKKREVLYRKYRFSSFADMCGQDQVASFFINTIKYNKISHAYLFAGPRGTGKTSMARLFAKILNCTGKTTYEACNKCVNCLEFDKGTAIDVIEKDAASNRGIDEIRSLCEDASFMPAMGRYKIFILDEAHMLTKEASNAFLKTLEEPPPYVIFILATTELHKISATILSRCQLVNFSRIPIADIIKRLEHVISQENISRDANDKIKYSREAILLIAKKASGGMRDALSLLEYLIAICPDGDLKSETVERLLGVHSIKVIKKFVDSVISKKADEGLGIIRKVHSSGNELLAFLEALNSYLISLVLIKFGAADKSSLECDEDDLADMREMTEKVDERYLFKLVETYSECLSSIRYVPDQLVHLEFMFIKSIMARNEEPKQAAPKPAAVQVPQAAAVDMRAIEAMINQKIAAAKITTQAPVSGPQQGQTTRQASPAPGASTSSGADTGQGSPGQNGPRQSVSIDRVKSAWNSTYLTALKQASIPTHAVLSAGIIRGITGDFLEIDFSKNTFCGERMQTGNHMKIAEDVFADVFGGRLSFRIMVPASTKGSAEQRKHEIIEEKKNDPTLKKILEAFDGEIIDVHE